MTTPLRTHALVLVALLALTAATVGVARLDLGASAVPVALGIAGTKALLIALFFMDLRRSPRLLPIVAAAGLLWLLLLFALTFADVGTRAAPADRFPPAHERTPP